MDTGESNVEDGTKGLTSLSEKDTRAQVGTYSWSEERGMGFLGNRPHRPTALLGAVR